MPNKTWDITLDNQSHKIEFKHSSITYKRSILVDGRQIELPKDQRRIQWDTGTKHKFDVSGHECLIATRSSGFDFKPELYIDGKNSETGLPIGYEEPTKVSDEAIRTRRIGVVVIMLLIGIGSLWLNGRMLLSSGGYFPFLSLLGPALLVISGYYAIFPDDPWKIPKPIPFRIIAMLILAFGLGIANLWATENGLYYLLFSSG
jgi:hypothetical protein